MKIKAVIRNFVAERETEYFRIEDRKSIDMKKIQERHSSEDLLPKIVSSEFVTIRKEPVWTFPGTREGIELYLKGLLPRKLLGLLKDTRDILGTKIIRGCKTQFEHGFRISNLQILKLGNIKKGFEKRFRYQGRSSMGIVYADYIDEFTIECDINNFALEEEMLKKAIDKMQVLSFGPSRNATLELIE